MVPGTQGYTTLVGHKKDAGETISSCAKKRIPSPSVSLLRWCLQVLRHNSPLGIYQRLRYDVCVYAVLKGSSMGFATNSNQG